MLQALAQLAEVEGSEDAQAVRSSVGGKIKVPHTETMDLPPLHVQCSIIGFHSTGRSLQCLESSHPISQTVGRLQWGILAPVSGKDIGSGTVQLLDKGLKQYRPLAVGIGIAVPGT